MRCPPRQSTGDVVGWRLALANACIFHGSEGVLMVVAKLHAGPAGAATCRRLQQRLGSVPRNAVTVPHACGIIARASFSLFAAAGLLPRKLGTKQRLAWSRAGQPRLGGGGWQGPNRGDGGGGGWGTSPACPPVTVGRLQARPVEAEGDEATCSSAPMQAEDTAGVDSALPWQAAGSGPAGACQHWQASRQAQRSLSRPPPPPGPSECES